MVALGQNCPLRIGRMWTMCSWFVLLAGTAAILDHVLQVLCNEWFIWKYVWLCFMFRRLMIGFPRYIWLGNYFWTIVSARWILHLLLYSSLTLYSLLKLKRAVQYPPLWTNEESITFCQFVRFTSILQWR